MECIQHLILTGGVTPDVPCFRERPITAPEAVAFLLAAQDFRDQMKSVKLDSAEAKSETDASPVCPVSGFKAHATVPI